MTNKLVVIINSLTKILLYEMKSLVQNYSCLQNPWLGSTAPRPPFSMSSVLNWICWTPSRNKIPGYATEWFIFFPRAEASNWGKHGPDVRHNLLLVNIWFRTGGRQHVCGERRSKRKSNDILAGSYEDTTLPYSPWSWRDKRRSPFLLYYQMVYISPSLLCWSSSWKISLAVKHRCPHLTLSPWRRTFTV
jgi:hypothetical protein